jgi:predicted DNA-binding transcriptional regulator AlpA
MNTEETTQLIDAKTLGQRLSLSKRQITRLNSCGKIPAPVKIGGAVRWRLSDIELWVKMDCTSRSDFEARRANYETSH